MSDNLVKRLRYEYPSIKERFELLEEAADRIELLEGALREIAGLSTASPFRSSVPPHLTMQDIARRALEGKR